MHDRKGPENKRRSTKPKQTRRSSKKKQKSCYRRGAQPGYPPQRCRAKDATFNVYNKKGRLRVVPHFSSGIVKRAKREHAWKPPQARKGDTTSSPPFFLRDSKACETRARVKITPSEKRWHAVGREKNEGLQKVLSDSPGLVDFAIRLVNSVFNLPDGQVMFYEEFE